MQQALGRIGTFVIVAILWIVVGVRYMLDLIGYATAPDDLRVAVHRVDQLFLWLMSLPSWMVFGAAALLTIWLAHVSWPRQSIPVAGMLTRPSAPPAAAAEQTELPLESQGDEPVDAEVYNATALFCVDYLLPVCDAQIELQKQLIRELSSSGYVAMYAWKGAQDHQKSHRFFDSYESLSGLVKDQPSSLPFTKIVECIGQLERFSYQTFCGQTHLISNSEKFEYKKHSRYGPMWEDWRTKHNAMVEAYEKIRRDVRFGSLHQLRPSNWGGIIPPVQSEPR